jgi:ABC-type transporter Mla MlaB component
MEKIKSTKKRKPARRVGGKSAAAASRKAAVVALKSSGANTQPDASASAGANPNTSPDANVGAEVNANTSQGANVNADANAGPVESAAAAEAGANTKFHLEPSLEIKDVEDVHKRLMARLARGVAVTVDISRIGAVDTAGVQLLVAFQSEAVKRGVSVEFCGHSIALTHALTVLGLGATVPIASAHD